MNLFTKAAQSISNFVNPRSVLKNAFNETFYWAMGGGMTAYDRNLKEYIKQGYNINPIVYSAIQQMASKTSSIPIYVKKVEDKQSMKKLERLRQGASGSYSMQQKAREMILSNKAFQNGEIDFPLEQPNPNQSWIEFVQLYKTFIRSTGNAYFYMLRVEEGQNAGKPMAIYCLPSHLMQIVLKKNANLLMLENPISHYMLIEGNMSQDFDVSDVIHIKYPNPNFDMEGSHLYGQSPLQASLKNIESSNEALNLNIKTMKSGGAFGFIHGKSTPLTAEQAAELKDRLVTMNNDSGNLGKIAGVSAEMGFTRMSLTSDELKPFDYLGYDEKQICNVLGWSTALLNNDNGGKYDKQLQERKRVVTDNIVPDLELLTQALNKSFLPLFKGYDNTRLEYDVMELPEMQDDATLLSQWLYGGLDKAVLSRNEVRVALRFEKSDDSNMDIHTVNDNALPLEETIKTGFDINE